MFSSLFLDICNEKYITYINIYIFFPTNKENLWSQIDMIPHIHDTALLEISIKVTLEMAKFCTFIGKLVTIHVGKEILRK